METNCEIIERQPQAVLFQRTRTPVSQLPELMGRVYGGIMQDLERQRSFPAGPPYAAYYNMDMQDLDVEIGIPVSEAIAGTGKFQSGEIPGGRYAACIYTGPYHEITAGYKRLAAWMEAQGLESSGLALECYLNDPASTPPTALQTQILFRLKD